MSFLIDTLKNKVMTEFQQMYVTASVPLPDFIKQPLIQLENLLYGHDLDQVKIEKPIFIIGCHRSGTTILYDTLAKHPDLAYFTNASSFLPNTPIAIHNLGKMLGLDKVEQERFIEDGINVSSSSPSEGIRIWENFLPLRADFSLHLTDAYENPQMEDYLKMTIKKHLKLFNRSRFMNKNPDNSTRVRYIQKLFPDAFFIHIVRDGRAVCNSLIRARQKAIDFFGADHPHANHYAGKEWEELTSALGYKWDLSSFPTAGVIWSEILRIVEKDSQFIDSDHYMMFRFEDFVDRPLDYCEKIIRFCQLDWTNSIQQVFEHEASKINSNSCKETWRKVISHNQMYQLMQIIKPTMDFYGYTG